MLVNPIWGCKRSKGNEDYADLVSLCPSKVAAVNLKTLNPKP